MSRLDDLKAVVEQRQQVCQVANAALREAEDALLVERFKDYEQYKKGDIVLVPRKLFGKIVQWPAQIEEVFLKYNTGTRPDGEVWENHHIVYRVRLLDKDTLEPKGGSSDAFYHREVQPFESEVPA